MIKMILCSLLIFFTSYSIAYSSEIDCFELAGHDSRIDPDLLRIIAWHESGLKKNAEGNNALAGYSSGFGIGLMQIDTQHLKYLSKYGIDRDNLLSDLCINIYAGAYFLSLALNKTEDTWDAVGAYNAGFKKNPKQENRRRQYAKKIYTLYRDYKERRKIDHNDRN